MYVHVNFTNICSLVTNGSCSSLNVCTHAQKGNRRHRSQQRYDTGIRSRMSPETKYHPKWVTRPKLIIVPISRCPSPTPNTPPHSQPPSFLPPNFGPDWVVCLYRPGMKIAKPLLWQPPNDGFLDTEKEFVNPLTSKGSI